MDEMCIILIGCKIWLFYHENKEIATFYTQEKNLHISATFISRIYRKLKEMIKNQDLANCRLRFSENKQKREMRDQPNLQYIILRFNFTFVIPLFTGD